MPSPTEMKIAELTKGMLRLKLFVIFSFGKGLDLKPFRRRHPRRRHDDRARRQ
jgi:hypothetical protein